MTLGVPIKAQGAVGLLGFCGLWGCSQPASVTFSLDCHVPLFLPESAVPALSPSVSTLVWLMRASMCS